MAIGRTGLVAVLDVGTSKVCCLIARQDDDGRPTVIGYESRAAAGMRAGTVSDPTALEDCVRHVVDVAERMAGETVAEVTVNIAGGQPRAQVVSLDLAVPGPRIEAEDVARLQALARAELAPGERRRIHAMPVHYSVDGTRVRDPEGMFGEVLGVDLLLIDVLPGPARNLEQVLANCHLTPSRFVIAPYASGLAVLDADERDLGTTVIDLGAGTTSFAVFYQASLIHAGVVSVGAGHVTNDLARGLAAPAAGAERLKTLYGSVLAAPTDERQMIHVPQLGEQTGACERRMPRSMLIGIIRPRLEETLELVRDAIAAGGSAAQAGRRVVLTGAGCELTGAADLASRVLNRPVRIGRPRRLRGLPEAMGGPAHATVAGLLLFAVEPPGEALDGAGQAPALPAGRLSKALIWLREAF